MQNIAVAVYVPGRIFTGIVSLFPGKRLSDFLNNDLINKSDGSRKFLKLTDVTIDNADGIEEKAGAVYINKEAIHMLRTLENDSARGIGAKDGPKQYPFVYKSPVRATMCLPGYELNGYLHFAKEKEISQLLSRELAFLPCTDTNIRDVNEVYSWNAGFVAINIRQVCSVHYS